MFIINFFVFNQETQIHWNPAKKARFLEKYIFLNLELVGFPFFRKKISILEMEWSGNLLRKPEFRDNSGSNGNRNVYGLRDVNWKIFRFTEWKP